MVKPLKYLPLPGVDQKDPDFFAEHSFFAEGPYFPSSDALVAPDPNTGNLPDEEPALERADHTPFKNMRSE